MGVQDKGRTYFQIPCEWCDKLIGRNNTNRHRNSCPKKPISEKTLGELTPEELEFLIAQNQK